MEKFQFHSKNNLSQKTVPFSKDSSISNETPDPSHKYKECKTSASARIEPCLAQISKDNVSSNKPFNTEKQNI